MNNTLKLSEAQKLKLSTKILSLATNNKLETHCTIEQQQKSKKRYKKKQRALTQEQIEVFKQAFEIFDSDHSGSIDEQQLESLLNALGFNYPSSKIKEIFNEVDTDGSGLIEINEFIDFMSKQILDTQSIKKQISKVFRHFDDNSNGFLDQRKIKNMLNECFFNLQEESIQGMISVADTDGDLRISEYEFLRIMKKVKLI